VLKVNGNK